MESYKHHLSELPEINKSGPFSRLFEGEGGSVFQEGAASTDAAPSSTVDINVKLWKGRKLQKHSSMPYSPSCPLDDISDDDDGKLQGGHYIQDFSATEGSSTDDQESLFMMVPDPLSSYLYNLKFQKFLETWQKMAAAPMNVGNDNVQGLKDCRFDSDSKNSEGKNLNTCFEDLSYSYSASCVLKNVSSDKNNVNPTAEKRMNANSKNKTKSGDELENSNDNEAYTPPCSDSDIDMVGDSPDSVPGSAAAMSMNSGQRMKKLNRIERISSEVKIALDPFFKKKTIDKEEYKYIMKGAVMKGILAVVVALLINIGLFFVGIYSSADYENGVPKLLITFCNDQSAQHSGNYNYRYNEACSLKDTVKFCVTLMPLILPPVALGCVCWAVFAIFNAFQIVPKKLGKGRKVDPVWLEPYETYDFYVGRNIPRIPGYDEAFEDTETTTSLKKYGLGVDIEDEDEGPTNTETDDDGNRSEHKSTPSSVTKGKKLHHEQSKHGRPTH
ncbi:unnamed protein product [Orchesella dallaii]|uniref:SFR19-like C-terminal domain-containing protein n=1 Tax=Orchesella dallaii TaxID=48710 RepID=A0ABP1QAV3_9HEXA